MNEPRTEAEKVDAIVAIKPWLDLRTPTAQEYAQTSKAWYISENGDFDDEAWQSLVGTLHAIEAEAATPREAPLSREALADVGAAARQWAEHVLAALPAPAAAPLDVETP